MEAEALVMVVELVDAAPERVGRVVDGAFRIEGGAHAVQRAVDRVPPDKGDHAPRRHERIV